MGKQQKRKGTSVGRGKDRQIRVRGIRRNPPDIQKFSRAIVALALSQAEADARAQADEAPPPSPPSSTPEVTAPGEPDER